MPAKPSSGIAKKKAPSCPTPDDTGSMLSGTNQRCLEATYLGDIEGPEFSQECWTLCSNSGYNPSFFYTVQESTGGCYCSNTW